MAPSPHRPGPPTARMAALLDSALRHGGALEAPRALGALVDAARESLKNARELRDLAGDARLPVESRAIALRAYRVLAGSQLYEERGSEGTLYLVVLPVLLRLPSPQDTACLLPRFEHAVELAAGAEYALGLPASSLHLWPQPARLPGLEAMSARDLRALARGLRAGHPPSGLSSAILGAATAGERELVVWVGTLFLPDAQAGDAERLRTLRRTPALARWSPRAAALVEEELFVNFGVVVDVEAFAPLLYQDSPTACRLVLFHRVFGDAVRRHADRASAVHVRVSGEQLDYALKDHAGVCVAAGVLELPGEPASLLLGQARQAATRANLPVVHDDA